MSRPSNNAVNASVLASRRLQGKRRAARPARYRERSAELQTRTARLHFSMSVKLSL
jgi:hypothetical protein